MGGRVVAAGDAFQPAVKDGGLTFLPGDAGALTPLNLTGNGINDARVKHLSFAAARRAPRFGHDVCELGRGWQAF
jgi:hypothetical protein